MKFIQDYKKTALVYREEKFSYAELIKNVKYFSAKIDINKEDKVAVFSENRPELIYSFFGVWDKLGTVINLDAKYTAKDLAYVLSDAKPKYIFTSGGNYKVTMEAIKLCSENNDTSLDITVINFDEFTDSNNSGSCGCSDASDNTHGSCGCGDADNYINSPEGDQVALLLYTSGTTGNPKGVMLTMNNIMSNIGTLNDINIYNKDDRFLALLPFHHVFPLAITLIAPLHGGASVIILEELTSTAIKNALNKYKITIMIGVPRLWEVMHSGLMSKIRENSVATKLFTIAQKLPDNFIGTAIRKKIFKKVHDGFGGAMRIMASGGAKLNPVIMSDFTTLGFTMLEGYGLTETSPIITFNRPNKKRANSAGIALPNVEVMIADDGEVIARGPNIMKGYLNNKKATDDTIDEDGWFHTGDLGKLEDGFLYIEGRKKEMIVLSNGKNINPNDIEVKIKNSSPLIEEIAVMEHNNHLLALILPDFKEVKKQNIANLQDKFKWIIGDNYNIDAPNYRKILEIKITKVELPKTNLGKVRRFMLPEFLEKISDPNYSGEADDGVNGGSSNGGSNDGNSDNGMSSSGSDVANQDPITQTTEYKVIAKFIKDILGKDIAPTSHLEIDLGLDSLAMMEILSFIDVNFSIQITEEDLVHVNNIKDIIAIISERGGSYKEEKFDWEKILTVDSSIDLNLNQKPSIIAKVIVKIIMIIIKTFMKTNVRNSKILSDYEDSACIIAGNHQSLLDGFIVRDALPNEIMKDTYFLAISSQFEGRVKQYLARNSNVILVDINKNLRETLQVAASVLRANKKLVIFPEGARTRDGNIQEFKKTFAILSNVLGIDVVPFALNGVYDILPYGKVVPNKGSADITFCDAIKPKLITSDGDSGGNSANDSEKNITAIVSRTVEQIKEHI